MKIHVCIPYALDKNLANAYNETFALIPDGDWVCLMDHDVLLLTPDAIAIMYEYVNKYPDAGIFTTWCNRIHELAKNQLFFGAPSNDFDIKNWSYRAKIQAMNKTEALEITRPISGFLMLVKKDTWKEIKFRGPGCLGVDSNFSYDILNAGKKIYRMDRIVAFHMYRMDNIRDKSHLK